MEIRTQDGKILHREDVETVVNDEDKEKTPDSSGQTVSNPAGAGPGYVDPLAPKIGNQWKVLYTTEKIRLPDMLEGPMIVSKDFQVYILDQLNKIRNEVASGDMGLPKARHMPELVCKPLYIKKKRKFKKERKS